MRLIDAQRLRSAALEAMTGLGEARPGSGSNVGCSDLLGALTVVAARIDQMPASTVQDDYGIETQQTEFQTNATRATETHKLPGFLCVG